MSERLLPYSQQINLLINRGGSKRDVRACKKNIYILNPMFYPTSSDLDRR
jgi:hypothetical protein